MTDVGNAVAGPGGGAAGCGGGTGRAPTSSGGGDDGGGGRLRRGRRRDDRGSERRGGRQPGRRRSNRGRAAGTTVAAGTGPVDGVEVDVDVVDGVDGVDGGGGCSARIDVDSSGRPAVTTATMQAPTRARASACSQRRTRRGEGAAVVRELDVPDHRGPGWHPRRPLSGRIELGELLRVGRSNWSHHASRRRADHVRVSRYQRISAAVDASWSPVASPVNSGVMRLASSLPSSTPHWSKLSMPHTAPCTNTMCS